jgi:hypothetical protein
MKQVDLVREITKHGANHDWYQQPATGMYQAVPSHREIKEQEARAIIRKLKA